MCKPSWLLRNENYKHVTPVFMLSGPSPSVKPVTAVPAAPGVGTEAMKPDLQSTPLIPAAGRQGEAGGSQSLRPACLQSWSSGSAYTGKPCLAK